MKRLMLRSLSFCGVLLLVMAAFGGFSPMRSQNSAQAASETPAVQSSPSSEGAQDGSGSTSLSPQTVHSQSEVAAEEEDDTAAYRHSASVRLIGRWLHLSDEMAARLFEYLNFAILAGGVLFGLAKYLPKTLRARRETLQKELVEARAATEQADVRLKAVEEQFARLDQEIAAIRAQAEKEGLAEEARIKALLEAERERIVTSAEQEIRAATLAAQRQLKVFAAELAVDRARKMISLTEDLDRVLFRQFTLELGTEIRNGGRT